MHQNAAIFVFLRAFDHYLAPVQISWFRLKGSRVIASTNKHIQTHTNPQTLLKTYRLRYAIAARVHQVINPLNINLKCGVQFETPLILKYVYSHKCRNIHQKNIANVKENWSKKTNYTVSKKTGPLRIRRLNFTNSQRLLIIFGRKRPHSILNWSDIKFLNWFRTSCVVAIATVVTWRTRTANFWADFEQRVIDMAVYEWKNNGLCQGRKTALRTLVVTFDIAHCSDGNTV